MSHKLLGSNHSDAAQPRRNLAKSLGKQGKPAEVEELLREELAIRRKSLGSEHPDVAKLLLDLALVLRDQGKWAEALTMLREAGNALAWNNLGWSLATNSDPKRRDGASAVSCAEMAVVLTGRTNALYLDTLAAAFAEVGQFGKAVGVQQEATAVLTNASWKEDFVSRLRLYEAVKPFREAKKKSAEPPRRGARASGSFGGMLTRMGRLRFGSRVAFGP